MGMFVVVSGLPGSGKSTVSAGLAQALDLPWISKDAILEALFESLGVGDRAHRERLSRTADAVLYAVAETSGGAILDNWWHHDSSPQKLKKLPGQIIEVFCDCPPRTALQRFQTRARHPGHLDRALTRSEQDAWVQQIQDSYPGPLGVGTDLIRVPTDSEIDIEALAQTVVRSAAPGADNHR